MKNTRLVLAGLLLGAFLTFSPVGVLAFGLFLLCIYLMKAYIKTESRDFLIKLFVAGFALRVVLALLNYFFGLTELYHASDTQPDAIIYNSNAFYVASVIRGPQYVDQFIKDPFLVNKLKLSRLMYGNCIPSAGEYQFGPFVYILGTLYAWLGYAPVAAKFLSGLFGALSAILTYFIARLLTRSEKTACISASLVMFFPSMFYWSVTLLQDTAFIFFFLLYVLSLLLYLMRKKSPALIGVFISLVFLCLLKIKVFPLFVVGFLLILVIKFLINMHNKKLLTKSIIFILILALLLTLSLSNYPKVETFVRKSLYTIFNQHMAFVEHSTANTFRIYKDFVYNKGRANLNLKDFLDISLVFSTFKALSYYFLAPFPWQISRSHPLLLIFYPQVVFTFIAIPFVLLGILTILRRSPVMALSLIALGIVLVLPQAMAEGVIGSVVRHRDMFTPFVLIFASYGFYLTILPKK